MLHRQCPARLFFHYSITPTLQYSILLYTLAMNRIDATFKKLQKNNSKAFIAYLTAGFPDFETNRKYILEMEKRGVDMVELGVPFSDPVADGPTIQASSQASLENGTTLTDVLRLAGEIREVSDIPLILMGYLNPFAGRRPELLAEDLRRAGIDGVIIPDLPPDNADFISEPLREKGIHTVFLLAPTSPPDRIELVAKKSNGFIYYVSRTGVTGAQSDLSVELKKKVEEIKRVSSTPVGVGFGISTRKQLGRVWEAADGAIVGSALIKPFLESKTPTTGMRDSLKVLEDLIPGC